ncbi:M20 metallopeptidase family protein [Evansella cellulosilytica]|uniref:Amidohydrolase n=1 Tax=Evansella cellulosilytica (strain ATCC 21833 / DSM 2522 / FERM P-1141 / JCM 9156 / N-4) TaxID=649639 RepID=E6U1V3_EVAC2|nr:amidohydrolase [Evansella cellulosilytica]ADU31600.1 amidohydrolase [Evansella cellulosilytica DSM 2522]
MKTIAKCAENLKQELIEWRRYFHQYPELSFEESNTSDYIVRVLKSFGITDIETNIAEHGIVATISNGPGRVIALRADMDALPIQEKTNLKYASKNLNVMHACGHDAHMSMLLGASKLLNEEMKDDNLKGTIKFIFQPAEESANDEGLTGAPYFIKNGILDEVDAIISVHVCPWRKVGEIQVNEGPSMANIDNFELTISGKGGHGGYPHQTVDPIWISSFVLQGIYSLISRKIDPLHVGTISVGELKAEGSKNVIPEKVTIGGTIRSYKSTIRSQLIKELEAVAKICEAFGGTFDLTIQRGEPALYNDAAITRLMKKNAKRLYPDMKIIEEPFGMGGEDFGHMTAVVPGSMFFLGSAFEEKEFQLHTPQFQLNEKALPIGVAVLTACACDLINTEVRREADDN